MESGFNKGQSDNLPKVTPMMVYVFYSTNPNFLSTEMRGIKALR
jgi:hypothetical protein